MLEGDEEDALKVPFNIQHSKVQLQVVKGKETDMASR